MGGLLGTNISGVGLRGGELLVAANDFGYAEFETGGLYKSIEDQSGHFVEFQRRSGMSGAGQLPAGAVFDLVGDPNDPLRFYVGVEGKADEGATPQVLVSLALSFEADLNAAVTEILELLHPLIVLLCSGIKHIFVEVMH